MKLSGLRVVDCSQFLPGPYLTLALADHGADVVKVEPPDGDPGRRIGLAIDDHTVFFRNLNRGKNSVVLDLKTTEGRDALLALVDSADVFVESFRPGVMERIGFGAATLRARNPRLVYCSISAFGQDGPYATRPAHDVALEAISGVLSLQRDDAGRPLMPAVPYADVLAGLQGLAGVLMALYRRERTGRGDTVDISMLDSMLGATLNILGPTFVEGREPIPADERTMGGSAFYRLYRTADDRWISLAGQEPKFVRALLNALGRPDLIDTVLQGPGSHQKPVVDFLEQAFVERTRTEWEARLTELDVCFGTVLTMPEAFADPQVVARGMLLRDAQGTPHVGAPIRFRDEPAEPSFAVPALGAHAATFDDAVVIRHDPPGDPT